MSKDNLVFNSRKCPGSVVVYSNGKGICIITKNNNVFNEHIKIGDRFVLPTLYEESSLKNELIKIKPGTYQEVKSAVIQAINNSNTKG